MESDILIKLPQALKENPELKYKIWAIMEENFPSREETNRILEEIRISREESNKRFAESDKKFEEMRTNMNKRFEAVDRRFEAVDRRFEAVDRRFEAVDRRFEEMHEEIMSVKMDLHETKRDITDRLDFMNVTIGRLQTRTGKNLEDTIAGALRCALKMEDIKPENVKLRQKIVDDEGIIGLKGKKYEFDVLITNKETIVFEIKSSTKREDIERFDEKCELVEKKVVKGKLKKVFISLEKRDEVVEECRKRKIMLY